MKHTMNFKDSLLKMDQLEDIMSKLEHLYLLWATKIKFLYQTLDKEYIYWKLNLFKWEIFIF